MLVEVVPTNLFTMDPQEVELPLGNWWLDSVHIAAKQFLALGRTKYAASDTK